MGVFEEVFEGVFTVLNTTIFRVAPPVVVNMGLLLQQSLFGLLYCSNNLYFCPQYSLFWPLLLQQSLFGPLFGYFGHL